MNYALLYFTINTNHPRNRDNSNKIIISGPVFTFVASDNDHSYNSQLAVFAIALTAKYSYSVSSPTISISNFAVSTFSTNSNSQSLAFLYTLYHSISSISFQVSIDLDFNSTTFNHVIFNLSVSSSIIGLSS
ncbi:hypothetical protein HOF65_00745 [bacterium]|nr:hypothetical protein [bacterium]MBT3852572.1 hypothetical protein [bacterium]MBT4632491.1 hypothetical protein [bacterium]MBT6778589.1 hypothetical protein [bacterium]